MALENFNELLSAASLAVDEVHVAEEGLDQAKAELDQAHAVVVQAQTVVSGADSVLATKKQEATDALRAISDAVNQELARLGVGPLTAVRSPSKPHINRR